MTNVVPLRAGAAAPTEESPAWRDVTDTAPPPRPGEPPTGEKGGGGGGAGGDAPADGSPTFGPVVPLGTGWSRGRKAYVLLDADGERQLVTARDLTQRATLFSLFGGKTGRKLLCDKWPVYTRRNKGAEPDDFDAEACGADLMSACGALGPAENVDPRSTGVWPFGERLLVHCGDVLWCDGRTLKPGFRDGQKLYIAAAKRDLPTVAATVMEVEELGESLKLWTWAPEHAGLAQPVTLGLVACGILGRAIPWRPHVFLRGPRGSGKTSLAKLIAAACGAGEPADDLTGPGLRRLFNGKSGLVPLDERESDAAGVEQVITIMRGSSDGDGSVKIQADMDGGGYVAFRVAGSFLMAATTLPALTPADQSRITMLQIRPGERDRRAEVEDAIERARVLYPKLLARLIAQWERWPQAWEAARKAAGRMDATSRSMDQVGALVAGWWILTQDGLLSDRVAAREMARFAEVLTTRAEDDARGAGHAVLTHLMGSRIQVADRTSDQMTVSAAIDRAVWAQVRWSKGGGELTDGFEDVEKTRRQLGANGLLLNVGAVGVPFEGRGWPWPFPPRTPDGEHDPPRPGLLIAHELPQLRGLFHSSDWPKGAWREPLRDLPGVRVSKTAVKFAGGGMSRVIFVPIALLPVTNDQLLGEDE
jgi:hypothetical protein